MIILFCQNCGNIGNRESPNSYFEETQFIEIKWQVFQFLEDDQVEYDYSFLNEHNAENAEEVRCMNCCQRVLDYSVEDELAKELFEDPDPSSRLKKFLNNLR